MQLLRYAHIKQVILLYRWESSKSAGDQITLMFVARLHSTMGVGVQTAVTFLQHVAQKPVAVNNCAKGPFGQRIRNRGQNCPTNLAETGTEDGIEEMSGNETSPPAKTEESKLLRRSTAQQGTSIWIVN